MPEEKTEEVQVVEETKVEPEVVVDPLAEKDAEIARLQQERDNYKTAALARKGKLPADSEILGEDFETFLEDKVKTVLADKEISRRQQEREAEVARITKENAELRLALKNRPTSGLGSDSGGSQEVKDNVLSTAQIERLKQTAARLKVDPDKFVENYKKNLAKSK